MFKLKSQLYHAILSIQTLFWHIIGYRRITAFGFRLKLSPCTIFPSYRKLRLPHNGYLSEIVRYGDFVQMHVINSRIELMMSPPVIIDVGAHHGAYAVMMGKLVEHRGGRVLAIEPNPISYKILVDNVRKNNLSHVVTCIYCAISDKCGPVMISLEDSQSSIGSNALVNKQVSVEAFTFNQLCADYDISYVSLLLIDVEGAELPVLRSIPWDTVPVESIFCEMHPYAWSDFDYDREKMTDFIVSRNLRCVDMYFREYLAFTEDRYIGPCLLLKK